jgi:hypothetical protein
LREALEQLIGRDVEDWTSLARRLRDDWRRDGVPMADRRDALLSALATLHEEAVDSTRRENVRVERNGQRRPVRPGVAKGFVSLVGAGPGDPELLTRRLSTEDADQHAQRFVTAIAQRALTCRASKPLAALASRTDHSAATPSLSLMFAPELSTSSSGPAAIT